MKIKTHKIIASVISCAAALVLAAGVSTQLFVHNDVQPKGALGAVQPAGALSASGGELDIEESRSTGISIMSAKIEPEAYAENGIEPQTVSAYTLTATVYPEDATDKSLDWSLAWDQSSELYYEEWYSVYEEEYDEWGDCSPANFNKYGITEENFLTVTALNTDKTKIQLTCVERFGCPINITCTARDGSGVSATCRVDLARTMRTAGIGSGTTIIPVEYTSSNNAVYYYVDLNLGTITPETTVTVNALLQTRWDIGTIFEDYNISTDYRKLLTGSKSMFWGESDWFYKEGLTTSTIFTYNRTWDTFCDEYIVCQDPTLSESQKRANRDVARRMLAEFKEKGILNKIPFFELSLGVHDSYTDNSISKTYYFYIDISKIPVYTTNVSDITLPDSIVL